MPLFSKNENTKSKDVVKTFKVSETKETPRKRAESGKNPKSQSEFSLKELQQSIVSAVQNYRGRATMTDAEIIESRNYIEGLVDELFKRRN